MTLDDVMKLEGRELDAAVAERLGWKWATFINVSILFPPHWYKREVTEHPALGWKPGKSGQPDYESAHFYDSRCNPPRTKPVVPHYSTDWNTAMQVREWAKSGEPSRSRMWVEAVSQCETARNRPTSYIRFGSDALLHAEPIDYARAALLVEQPS